jgi:hypothetical protein
MGCNCGAAAVKKPQFVFKKISLSETFVMKQALYDFNLGQTKRKDTKKTVSFDTDKNKVHLF